MVGGRELGSWVVGERRWAGWKVVMRGEVDGKVVAVCCSRVTKS